MGMLVLTFVSTWRESISMFEKSKAAIVPQMKPSLPTIVLQWYQLLDDKRISGGSEYWNGFDALR
jgi:hypothetical protein